MFCGQQTSMFICKADVSAIFFFNKVYFTVVSFFVFFCFFFVMAEKNHNGRLYVQSHLVYNKTIETYMLLPIPLCRLQIGLCFEVKSMTFGPLSGCFRRTALPRPLFRRCSDVVSTQVLLECYPLSPLPYWCQKMSQEKYHCQIVSQTSWLV